MKLLLYLTSGIQRDRNGTALIAAKSQAQALQVQRDAFDIHGGKPGGLDPRLSWDVPTFVGYAKASVRKPQVIASKGYTFGS